MLITSREEPSRAPKWRDAARGAALALLLLGCDTGAQDAHATAADHDPLRSPFNGLRLDPSGDWSEYTFEVFGHIRGPRQGPPPNPRVRANIGRMLAVEPRFLVCLGDIYFRADPAVMQQFQDWTIEAVDVPFYNAIGNHDVQVGGALLEDGTVTPRTYESEPYVEKFGPTYFSFRLGSELFVFLDFEVRGMLLRDEAWEWFQDVVAAAARDEGIRNVFLFHHKVVWSYNNPETAPVFTYRHPVPVSERYDFFRTRMKPLLAPLVTEHGKNVTFFAGDIGGGGQYLQLYHHRDDLFTYVATGMGAEARDNFVVVSVKDGVVTMKAVRLADGVESELSEHGNDAWEAFYRENPRLEEKARYVRGAAKNDKAPSKND